MVSIVKSCLRLSMKLVNSIIGMVGIAMVLYSLWLIRVWQHHAEGSSSDDHSSFPWFIHAFIGLGISFCAIACLGHVAADRNTHILSFYILLVFLLLLLVTGTMADVFLNSDWEKDFPDDFKDIVESNMDVCKCVGLLIVLAQGFSILLATVIRTLGTDLETITDSDMIIGYHFSILLSLNLLALLVDTISPSFHIPKGLKFGSTCRKVLAVLRFCTIFIICR